jgi:ketosteroid isomerase-like protein
LRRRDWEFHRWRIVDPMAAASDVTGVLAAVDDFGTCLEARDLSRTVALLADDPDLTVIPSEGVETYRGPAAVEGFFQRIYAGQKRYAWRWRDRWVSIHGDWASFVAIGDEFVDVEGTERRIISYCLTGTLVRRDGGWRFQLLHGSEDSSAGS